MDPRNLGGVREHIAYATAVLVAWLLALVLRALLRSGGGQAVEREPDPESVAYLTGGPKQAVYAAVAALRSTGSVAAAGYRIYPSGPLPPGGGGLATAVYHAVQGGTPVTGLPAHPPVRAELDRIGDRLRGQGVLLSPGRRWAMRLAAVPLFLLALFGGIRFALNLPTDDVPEARATVLAILTLLFALVALNASIIVAARAQIRTRGATRLVHELRRRYDALAPRHHPSLTGNGPVAATLAVGLFGTAALYTADRAFAEAANVTEQRVTGRGGYSGDGGFEVNADSSCSTGGGT